MRAFIFAQQAGLDVDAVIEVISQGAAQSWQMNNRAETMARDEYEFGFAVDWMRKDLNIALEAARELDARLPLTALVDQFYADVQSQGGGEMGYLESTQTVEVARLSRTCLVG